MSERDDPDLVKRLREDIAYQQSCKYPSEARFNEELLREAADEIERLQRLLSSRGNAGG